MKHTIHLHVVLDIFSAQNLTSNLTALLIGVVLGLVKLSTMVGQFFSCVHTALKWSILVCHHIWNLYYLRTCYAVPWSILTAVCPPKFLIHNTLLNYNLWFHALPQTR
jgi:hypothetical protein